MSRSRWAAFPAMLLGLAVVGLWPSISWAQMYRWTDEQGGTHYGQGIYAVPERFRSRAQLLTFPERPAAPAASPSSAEGAVSQGARISFTPGKPIMVSAKINGGGSAQLMLDTGASVTVINPRVLAGMATGSPDVLFVPVESIEVGGARSGPLRVAAHDVDLGQGDGLLGRDFLDQFTVNIDSTAGVVTLSPK